MKMNQKVSSSQQCPKNDPFRDTKNGQKSVSKVMSL